MKNLHLLLIAVLFQIVFVNAQSPCDDPCTYLDPAAAWLDDGNYVTCDIDGSYTPTFNPTTCNSSSVNDAWAWIIGTGDTLLVDYMPSSGDPIIHVFDTLFGCPTYTEIACADDYGTGAGESLKFKSVNSVLYLIRIQEKTGGNMTGSLAISNLGNGSGICEIAHYPFSGNPDDIVGTPQNGTVTNATLVDDRWGTIDGAYDFNGTNANIEISSTGMDFSNGVTFMAWFKADSYKDATIVGLMNNTDSGFALRVRSNGEIWASAGNSVVASSATSIMNYDLGEWYHIAGTWNSIGGSIELYINGMNENMSSQSYSYTCTQPVYIGQMYTGFELFDGIIDDVRIFDCPLDMIVIDSIYQEETPYMLCETANYPFNNNSNDESGNNFHLSSSSMPSISDDRFGNPLSAYDFDGIDDSLVTDSVVIPDFGAFTVNVWAKHDGGQSDTAFILMQGHQFISMGKAGIGPYFYLGKNEVGGVCVGEDWHYTNTTFPTDNQWHMYTVVMDGYETYLFIDGNKVDTAFMAISNPGAPPFVVGCSQWNTNHFDGKIDDIQVFECALDSEDILSLYSVVQITAHPESDSVCVGSGTMFSVTATGPGLNYQWYHDQSILTGETMNTLIISSAQGSDSGDYYCMVWSGNDTVYSNIASLVVSDMTLTGSPTDPTCYGGSDGAAFVDILGGGIPGYTFLWDASTGSQATQTAGSLNAGSYTCTVTDFIGCTATQQVTLGEPPAIIIDNEVGTDVSCYGMCDGSVIVSASGGTGTLNYEMSIGSNTSGNFSGLCTGAYTVTVTDMIGCTEVSNTINVFEPSQISSNELIINNACAGLCNGEIQLTPSGGNGGYTYTWTGPMQFSSGDEDIDSLCTGTYNLTIVDNLGCDNDFSFDVNSSGALSLTLSLTDASCGSDNGEAEVSVTGGAGPYTYNWSNGDTLYHADTLSAGMHHVQVMDANGCYAMEHFMINSTGGQTITANTITNVSCYGHNDGAIEIDVSGISLLHDYVWSNSETTEDISNLTAGYYQLMLTDVQGCVTFWDTTILEPDILNVGFTLTNPGCGGTDGIVQANVTGGVPNYNYAWSNSGSVTNTITGLGAGMYYVTITDANGCTAVKGTSLTSIGGPVVTLDSIVDVSCGGNNGAIYVSITGGSTPYASFNWSNSTTNEDLAGVGPGVYELTVTDAGGCIAVFDAEVDMFIPLKQPICVVSVDTITLTNLIVWEKVQSTGIDHYNIYRESWYAGQYSLIASVAYDDMSEYTDPFADPRIRSWRYKISAVDSCGNESPLSDLHKTIHLTTNVGLGMQFNLVWDHYEGFQYYTYYINRHTNQNGWELIDSLPANLTSYTDSPPALLGLRYFVSVNTPGQCIPTSSAKANGGPYSQSSSNMEDEGVMVSIKENITSEIKVYPNPNRGEFVVKLPEKFEVTQISLYDLTGNLIITKTTQDAETWFRVHNVARGVYVLKVSAEEQIVNYRILIQ